MVVRPPFWQARPEKETNMALQSLLKELANLSDKEKAELAKIFAPKESVDSAIDPQLLSEVKSDLRKIYPNISESSLQSIAIKQINTPRTKQAAKPPKAERVYFFRQVGQFITEDIEPDKDNPDILRKTGYILPPRVIAVDKKGAWRLYWKQRNKYQFLGSSDGTHWREARERGMPITEAYGVEFDYMQKNPDMTVPMNREKTAFHGTTIAQVSRGTEMDWGLGLKQTGKS